LGDVIDAHVHLFGKGNLPAQWYQHVKERWAASTWPNRDPEALDAEGGIVDPDGSLLMEELDRAGIATAICMGLDWGVEFDDPAVDIASIHAHFGEVQRNFPGRFYAIAGVDPRRPNAVELLEEAIGEHGLKGLKLYPPSGYYPSDEVCEPLLAKCVELGVPVVIHTAYVGWPHVARYANPLWIGDVQLKFKDLKIVFAHSGHEVWAEEAMLTASDHPGSYLELSNWNWNLAGDHDELARMLLRMRDHVGAHKMLFASDHLGGRRFSGKRSTLAQWVDFVRDLPQRAEKLGLSISEEEIELILGENAKRVFTLDGAG
jgi:uncharacterized protein